MDIWGHIHFSLLSRKLLESEMWTKGKESKTGTKSNTGISRYADHVKGDHHCAMATVH